LVEHRGEIVAGRIIRSSSRSHLFSRCGYGRPFGLRAYRTCSVRVPQTLTTATRENIAIAGRQHACTFDTLI
ncbi:MAG: hypothetical protein ACJ8EF_19575, partial [Bradyrhizobium sp.]